MAKARRTEHKPHDRLTRMCDRLSKALQDDPEHRDGDQMIVFLTDEHRGGLVTINYDDDREALSDILFHLQAVMEAHGQTLTIGTLGPDGKVEKIA